MLLLQLVQLLPHLLSIILNERIDLVTCVCARLMVNCTELRTSRSLFWASASAVCFSSSWAMAVFSWARFGSTTL